MRHEPYPDDELLAELAMGGISRGQFERLARLPSTQNANAVFVRDGTRRPKNFDPETLLFVGLKYVRGGALTITVMPIEETFTYKVLTRQEFRDVYPPMQWPASVVYEMCHGLPEDQADEPALVKAVDAL